jgi:hypothetical protein
MQPYEVVKVFTATKARDRDEIGPRATAWLRTNPELVVVDKQLRLSSDSEFHCLSLVLFCRKQKRRRRR